MSPASSCINNDLFAFLWRISHPCTGQRNVKNLSSYAGTLTRDVDYVAQGSEVIWHLKGKDGSQDSLFYDSGDVVSGLGQWLDDMKAARSTGVPVGTGLAPLYINGNIKVSREAWRRLSSRFDSCSQQVGKSTVLSSILPKVIANHVEFGVGGASEVVILSLDLSSLPVEKVRVESHYLWTRIIICCSI